MTPDRLAHLLLFRFVLERGAELRFFHAPTVYAFFHARLGTRPDAPFPNGVRFLPVESGRTRYAAGEAYHVAVALLAGAEIGPAELIGALRRPRRSPKLDRAPLGSATRLVRVTDLISGREWSPERPLESEPEWLTLEAVRRQAARISGATSVTVVFDSPLLVLRQPVQRRDTYLDEESFDAAVLLDRVARAASGHFPVLEDAAPISAKVVANRLARAETYYRGAGGSDSPAGKILPGATGSVTLELSAPLTLDWALRLLLAGLAGAGKSTSMGQGRFHVAGAPPHPRWPPRAAATLCERMARDDVLARAREAMRTKSIGRVAGASAARAGEETSDLDDGGSDGAERADFVEALSFRLPLLREALATAEHRPRPLRGLLLERPHGKVRALAVPTLEDRFLQRACVEELGPAVDELLEEASFAYRRGLSRRNAEYHVRRAHDEGYRHVIDADLRAFFDRVDWDVLRHRLAAYFGDDPAVELLMRWVSAPVEFGDHRIERRRGLPQGAVISPLLANLYLDSFDEAIQAEGFRLVRYADDFVILCKSADDTARAREVAERELLRLRLELASEKTSVTTFDRGFEFLGYLFSRSVALEKKPAPRAARVLRGPEALESLRALDGRAAQGWLADWLGQDPAAEPLDAPRFRTLIAPSSPARRNVYVVEPGLRLTGSHRGLRVHRDETLLDEVAWGTLSEVAVLGQRPMAASLFQQAMRHRVPVALYSRAGRPLGVVLPERVRTPAPATRLHWQWSASEESRLRVARALVEAKIHNQRLLARHQDSDTEALRDRLALLGQQAQRAERVARLRGIEGAAAHTYFAEWPSWLPGEFSFPGRSGRGARDPVNALLNLLYTQLFHRCWLACVSQGLDPFLGILHEPSERYAALAADLQEPFRFLCDRLVLDLLHRGRLARADFVVQEKPEPLVRLKPEALRLVIGEWERRLEARVKATGGTHSYRGHIQAQAERLGALIRGERQDVGAFRLKW